MVELKTKYQYERYYPDLFNRIKEVASMRVPLTLSDRIKYRELLEENPQVFFKNATKDFYMEMRRFIREGKVWRINCSGRVRHGKSEDAQTWTMLFIDEYNLAFLDGCYDHLKLQGIEYNQVLLEKLWPDTHILFSQSNYLYALRELQRDNKLIFGFPRIIDEDQVSMGGTGSYSEKIEIENVNNITAQSLQCEWQLRPDRFILLNAPYGLHQEKMDRKNKVNWAMLYEFNTDPTRTRDYQFIGWVATPLHPYQEVRIRYNEMKKENIKKVYEGTADLRMLERVKVAKLLAADTYFNMRSTNGAVFKLSKGQQEAYLVSWIVDHKVQNFNSIELGEIIEYARMLAEKEYLSRVDGGAK